MPNLIFFFHPGQQIKITNNSSVIHKLAKYRYDDYGIRKQNIAKDHKRKFIMTNGAFIDKFDTENIDNNKGYENKYNKITFWGEWEAESYYKYIDNSFSGLNRPSAIHYPIFVSNPTHTISGNACHSTDPWVFHNPIFLTHCHMYHYPMVRTLGKNDILILGSVSGGYFVIDTVFVVDEIVNINDNNISSGTPIFAFKDPDVFYDTNYRHYLGGHLNVFYKGRVYDKDNPTLFSFFPCSADKSLFPRPEHHRRKMGMGVAGQGNGAEYYSNTQILNVWLELVKLVQSKGLQLGLYADEPQNFASFSDAEIAFNPKIFV